jgi:hypothetical protein
MLSDEQIEQLNRAFASAITATSNFARVMQAMTAVTTYHGPSTTVKFLMVPQRRRETIMTKKLRRMARGL